MQRLGLKDPDSDLKTPSVLNSESRTWSLGLGASDQKTRTLRPRLGLEDSESWTRRPKLEVSHTESQTRRPKLGALVSETRTQRPKLGVLVSKILSLRLTDLDTESHTRRLTEAESDSEAQTQQKKFTGLLEHRKIKVIAQKIIFTIIFSQFCTLSPNTCCLYSSKNGNPNLTLSIPKNTTYSSISP